MSSTTATGSGQNPGVPPRTAAREAAEVSMRSVAGLLSIAMLLAGAAQAQSPEVSIEDAAPVAEDSGTSATFTVTLTQPTPIVYGQPHTGMYHLGPVDFAETQWHNACAPGGGYVTSLREATGLGGEYLAGVSNLYAQGAAPAIAAS
jgi:hypothetical protein